MTEQSNRPAARQFVPHLTEKYFAVRQAYASGTAQTGFDFSRVGNAYSALKTANRKTSVFNKILGRNHFACMPVQVQIDNIGFCNLRCVMCPTHGADADHAKFQSKTYTMSRDMVDRIAAESFPYALQCSTSGIGEGLLHRDIDTIIRQAGRYGTTLFINSNCTTLGARSVPKLFGITNLQLSIDGALPGTFEAIRKGARYEKVLHACRVLKIANDLLPPALRMPIGINYALSASTVRETPIMIDLAEFVGASSLQFNKMEFLVNQTYPKEQYLEEDYERYPAYYAYYRERAEARARACGIRLSWPEPFPEVAPDRLAGPADGGLFARGGTEETTPDFAGMTDANAIMEEAVDLAEKALLAAIERHSEYDDTAYRRAEDEAQTLAAEISEGFEQRFAALTPEDRDLIRTAPNAETLVHDCVFLHTSLYFMANGETRPCCIYSLPELAGDARTQSVKEIYQGEKLARFSADFRKGVLCEECQSCRVKGIRPLRELVRSLL